MQIVFNLPHVFTLEASRVENAEILRSLLELLIQINISYIRNHAPRRLYRSGVVYGRTSIWEPIPALYERGYGDCKSLASALIAERVCQGKQAAPVFRFSPKSYKGAKSLLFHILVQTPQGFEDPSRRLGMGTDEWKAFQTPQ